MACSANPDSLTRARPIGELGLVIPSHRFTLEFLPANRYNSWCLNPQSYVASSASNNRDCNVFVNDNLLTGPSCEYEHNVLPFLKGIARLATTVERCNVCAKRATM